MPDEVMSQIQYNVHKIDSKADILLAEAEKIWIFSRPS